MLDAVFSRFPSAGFPHSQAVVAAAPILVVLALLLASMLAFWWRGRGYHDDNLESRGATPVLGMWLRRYFSWLTQPVVTLLMRAGVKPNAITITSALLATAAALSIALGHIATGGWLFAMSALCDFLDGRVARATGRSSARGALLDSVLDRYVEGALLMGLAWFYRNSWLLAFVLAALVGSLLVSYVKARGEALGVPFRNVGLMQRPERVVLLALALVLSPPLEAALDAGDPAHRLVAVAVLLLAVTTSFSAAQRFVHAYRALPAAQEAQREAEASPSNAE